MQIYLVKNMTFYWRILCFQWNGICTKQYFSLKNTVFSVKNIVFFSENTVFFQWKCSMFQWPLDNVRDYLHCRTWRILSFQRNSIQVCAKQYLIMKNTVLVFFSDKDSTFGIAYRDSTLTSRKRPYSIQVQVVQRENC